MKKASQIENIQAMEKVLDDMSEIVENMEKLTKEWKKIQPSFEKLMIYYGSDNWYQDIKDYDSKKISQIKAWVLSQDAIYNLYGANRELCIDIMKVALKYLEKN